MKSAAEILVITSKEFTQSLFNKTNCTSLQSNLWDLKTTAGRKILYHLFPEIFYNKGYHYQFGSFLPDGFYLFVSIHKTDTTKSCYSINPQKILKEFNYN